MDSALLQLRCIDVSLVIILLFNKKDSYRSAEPSGLIPIDGNVFQPSRKHRIECNIPFAGLKWSVQSGKPFLETRHKNVILLLD